MLRPGDPAALAREAALGLLASWSACSAPSVTCSSYGTSSVLSSKASTENSDSIPLPLVNRSLQLQGTCRRTFVKLVGLLGLPGSCSRHTKELIGDGDVESPPPPPVGRGGKRPWRHTEALGDQAWPVLSEA